MLRSPNQILSKAGACAALVLALCACGGGDDAKPESPATATSPGISGVAAIGAPIAGGSVTCKCASGTNGSATSATDGSFNIHVADSDFPCALSVTGGTADGKPLAAPLHSVAATAGTANITPLTDQMVRSLAGEDRAKWFAHLTQGDIGATITAEKLAEAFTKLKIFLALLPNAPALPADFHPVTTPFKAEKGDAADDLLERYGHALRAADRPFGESTSPIAEVTTPIADEREITQTMYTGRAFSVPGWTSFPISVRKLANGTEALIVRDPNLPMHIALIEGRDAEGDITALDPAGPFTSILSLMGNRIGMLSGRDSRFKNTVSKDDRSSAHYIYLSDEFTEVDHRELYGTTFTLYMDGRPLVDAKLGTDGKLRAQGTEEEDVAPWFSADGMRQGERETATILRSKAYKYTANGKTTYVVVSVNALDPDVPEALPENQSVGLAVSH